MHDVNRSLLVTGFGYEHDDCWLANMELFKQYTDVAQGVRRLGSAAIDMCHVASGGWGRGWGVRVGARVVAGGAGKASACCVCSLQTAYCWGWGIPLPQPPGLHPSWHVAPP